MKSVAWLAADINYTEPLQMTFSLDERLFPGLGEPQHMYEPALIIQQPCISGTAEHVGTEEPAECSISSDAEQFFCSLELLNSSSLDLGELCNDVISTPAVMPEVDDLREFWTPGPLCGSVSEPWGDLNTMLAVYDIPDADGDCFHSVPDEEMCDLASLDDADILCSETGRIIPTLLLTLMDFLEDSLV